MQEESSMGLVGALGAAWGAIAWLFQNIAMAFYNFAYAVTHPQLWLDWSNSEALMRFIYYGASAEFFFVVLTAVLVITAIGIWHNRVLWAVVRVLEGFANTTGRFFAWAGLLMVIQQVVIVVMQRIFNRPDIVLGLGIPVEFDISWYAEELKLYNAMVVAMCATYTFVQGGHVRVDLFYAGVRFRTKKVIDMIGSLLFMLPLSVVIWLYGWFFLWRHLVVPNPSASDTLERLLLKARALRWNVETVSFSPNGFSAYFLFKILLLCFAGMVFIHAVAFFYRSFLEFKEGEGSSGKYLDRDNVAEAEEAIDGTH